jgi:hypothetical protein
LGSGLDGRTVFALSTDPTRPNYAFAGTGRGLFLSAHEGDNWKPFDLHRYVVLAVAAALSGPYAGTEVRARWLSAADQPPWGYDPFNVWLPPRPHSRNLSVELRQSQSPGSGPPWCALGAPSGWTAGTRTRPRAQRSNRAPAGDYPAEIVRLDDGSQIPAWAGRMRSAAISHPPLIDRSYDRPEVTSRARIGGRGLGEDGIAPQEGP